jgi:ssDNA-binding replication factor A large subunit
MPIPEIIKKLSTESKKTEDEIKQLVQARMDEHNGLVSEEGAAHIVAHDLKVELFKTPTETGGAKMKISDLVIGMNNFEIIGKVSQIFQVREFQKQGKTSQVGNFNIQDESGTTRIVLWDQKANIIKDQQLEVGQVVKIRNGNIKSSNFSPNGKELHLTIRSQMILDAEEKVNVEITPVQSSGTSREVIAAKLADIAANQNVKVCGTVVRIYPPAFYDSCPQCGKKAVANKCKEHGDIQSKPAMVFSIILDDGTGAVRCTAFRDNADKLAGMTGQQAKDKTENPVALQEELDEALGKIIEIQGIVRENKQFDRTEITINSAKDLNPIEIAKQLMKD